MNQDAVVYTRGTTHHKGDAIMETPTHDSGDVGVAYGAEPTLVMPEKAKCSSTPKRFRHVIPLAFLEVGLPSSQTALRPSGPLRTVHASFPAHSSSPSKASFKETRIRYGKILAVNSVV